ncbi:LPXTG cell wall anchor domain-containing protein [Spirillospora sp. NPDC048819]|uniref:LPXTG cell wall anchor domain-containing protein n=1 Tax=Spirillospora sp. NPDC048819 TaxID=3155268 RepID=UPI0033FF0CEE
MRSMYRRLGVVTAIGAVSVVGLGPSALAAPALKMSKTTGVKVGESITVESFTGLKPGLQAIVIGQCKPVLAQGACVNDKALVGGKSDAAGTWVPGSGGPKSIVLVEKIGDVDCTAKAGACVIAATSLLDPTAVLAKVPLDFASGGNGGGGSDGGGGDGGNGGGGTGGGGGGGDGDGQLPHTGSPDGLPTYALVASALVMAGGAALFIIPRRRRES